MNLEQQYPESENIIDWSTPDPLKDQQSSFAPIQTDPMKRKLKGLENRSGRVRLRITLPISGKIISNEFPDVPTYQQLEDFTRDADRRASFEVGKLHPGHSIGLDLLEFEPNEILNQNHILGVGLRDKNGKVVAKTDEGLQRAAKALGIRNYRALYNTKSPEFRQAQVILRQYNANRSGLEAQYIGTIEENIPSQANWVRRPSDMTKNKAIEHMMYVVEQSEFTKDKFDPGGRTKFGISEKDKDILKQLGLTLDNIKHLTPSQAKQIYEQKYWNSRSSVATSIKGHSVTLPAPKDIPNPRLAYAIFDVAVNPYSRNNAEVIRVYNDKTLSPDQKADKIIDLREDAFRSHPHYAEGLVTRMRRGRNFVGSYPSKHLSISWKAI